MSQLPSVGRIVHFYAPPGCAGPKGLDGPYAAIITGVNASGTVNLTTFGPSGSIYPHRDVEISLPDGLEPVAGGWNWPPRTP